MNKKDLMLNDLQCFICHKTKPNHIVYLIYMYKEDLALNNIQWLIYHKIYQNQITYINIYVWTEYGNE